MKMQGISKIQKYIIIGFLLVLSGRICMYGLHLGETAYYACLALLGIMALLTTSDKLKPNLKMFAIYACMWLSILANIGTIDPIYKAPQRNVAFFLVLVALGPFFHSQKLSSFRVVFFNMLNLFFVAISCVSFIGKFSFLGGRIKEGFYMGCTHHSMMLGCISGYSALVCLDAIFQIEDKKKFWSVIGACLASVLMTLYASSRVVVASLLVAMPFYIFRLYQHNLGKKIKIMLASLVIIGIGLTVFEDATRGIMSKMNKGDVEGTIVYSRRERWNARIEEFMYSPVFGCGTHTLGKGTDFEGGSLAGRSSGIIEPGNAWLYFLSSMGLVGFLTILAFIGPVSSLVILRSKPKTDGVLIGALLVFSFIYMMAEAHVTASGDYNCIYFWLLIAIATIPGLNEIEKRRIGLLPAWDFLKNCIK